MHPSTLQLCSGGPRAVFFAPLLAASLAGACATPEAPQANLEALLADSTLVDLTHTFDEATIVWPTSNPFRLEKVADGVTPGGYYYAANNVHTAEHGGTHLDAPIHFAAGQQTAEAVPLSRLVGPAVVVDVTPLAEADADALVTTADLQTWEATHGAIDRGSLVLLRTGFSTRWPDAARYLGTAARGEEGVAQLHFPGLHPDAATWLVQERGVGAVGIDTASIDRGQSTSFDAHRVLAAANVPAFENLAHLDQLPARGAFVFALPMKVGGGSGAPLRAVAVVPKTSVRR
jgi:kynurenine formamidase